MQPARLAGAVVQTPQGYVFRMAAPSPYSDGSWRLADARERRVGWVERRGVRGNAIAFA